MIKFWEGSSVNTSLNKTSSIFSLIVTVILWVLFIICAILIKPAPKQPKFKEVQIVLEPFQMEKKTEVAQKLAAAAPAPAASVESTESVKNESPKTESIPEKKNAPSVVTPDAAPVAESKQEPVKKTEPVNKPAPVKKAEPVKQKETVKPKAPVKSVPVAEPEPVVYGKSVEELMEEQLAAKSSKKSSFEDFNWDDMFEDDVEETVSANVNTVTSQNSISGVAGQMAETSGSGAVSQSQNQRGTDQTVSKNTQNALSGIRNSKFLNGTGVYDSEVDIKTDGSQADGVRLSMSNGHGRVLLTPKEPKIVISEENAKLIPGTITVKISFTVMESGNVPRVYIQISQSALLPSEVVDEIKDQLKEWRFETADYQATASFDFTIVKK